MRNSFVEQNCAVFDCPSARLCAGDLVNEPATYALPFSGIGHVQAQAFRTGRSKEVACFSVDSAQIFLVDATCYERLRDAAGAGEGTFHDHDVLLKLRKKLRINFGMLVPSDLFDSEFSGDGTYWLDLSFVQPGAPKKLNTADVEPKEWLRRQISSMNTLVCFECYEAEILRHPDLGTSPSNKAEKKKWCEALAVYAMDQGWTVNRTSHEVIALCPDCQKKRKRK